MRVKFRLLDGQDFFKLKKSVLLRNLREASGLTVIKKIFLIHSETVLYYINKHIENELYGTAPSFTGINILKTMITASFSEF